MQSHSSWHKQGQAVFIGVLFLVVLSSLVVKNVVTPLVQQVNQSGEFNKSQSSYYAAESGSEDATYRLKNNLNVPSSYDLSVGSSTASVTVSGSGSTRTVVTEGDANNSIRTQQANLTLNTNSAQFFYGVQVGNGGFELSGSAGVRGNVYSNGNIVGSGAPFITGSAVVAGGISDTPSVLWDTATTDQFFANGAPQVDEGSLVQSADQFFATSSASRDIAQSFTPSSAGPLNQVWIYLAKIGSPNNLTVRVTNDNNGKPSTSSLASVTLNASGVATTPGWINAVLNSPPTLVAGTKYWIVLDYSTNSTSNYWNWRKDPTDAYANNTGKYTSDYSSGSAVWTNVGGDLSFRIGVGEGRDIAQSFTATVGDKLNRVSLLLAKVGSPSSNLTLRLVADNNGKPATASIVTTTVSPAGVGTTPSWVDVAFTSPPTLTNGAKYWLVLDSAGSSATNYWNWRKDTGDGYANNTGKFTSDYSSASAVWTNVGGDLGFKVWLGGTNTKIEGMIVGDNNSGLARANVITSSTVHGSACPNQYCVIDNPPRVEMPISDGLIADWKAEAAAGGVYNNSTSTPSYGTSSLGPKKIVGNLTVSGSHVLKLTGTVWVTGNVIVSGAARIELDATKYGSGSGLLVADGYLNLAGSGQLNGTGQSGSYLMFVTTSDCPASAYCNSKPAIDISGAAGSVILSAQNGTLQFSGSASAREAVANKIIMSGGTTVTYDTGLANINFSSGPGATFDITGWQEL